MAKYHITQTLISAWNYMYSCRDECVDDARDAFINTLCRLPQEPTEAMTNGILFEHEVYLEAAGAVREPHVKWESGIKAVASHIQCAQTQVRLERDLLIGDKQFVVYGILDALKAGTIYDVKFCNKSFHSTELAGKYLNSPQHPTYFYIVPEAYQFKYLVSDGKDLYTETYTRNNTTPFEDIASEFVKYLEDTGLWVMFEQKWRAY